MAQPWTLVAQSLTVTHLAGSLGGPGSVDGTGTAARFNTPWAVAVDAFGNVYVADLNSSVIRKMTPGGVVTTLAGMAGSTGSADGVGAAARFFQPMGLAVDSAGTVYVADTYNNTIRKVSPAGVVTTLAGRPGGGATSSMPTDGTGAGARFFLPQGVAVDAAGIVYVADTGLHTIRKITPAGVVTTIAGKQLTEGYADGTGASARFNDPVGIVVDSAGNLYVSEGSSWDGSDTTNHTIRKITPDGTVTTLAGAAGQTGSSDGPGTIARFNMPKGMGVDAAGVLFVADFGGNTVRKIAPDGYVTTLAGSAGTTGSTDGTGSAARFYRLSGVAAGPEGSSTRRTPGTTSSAG